MILQIDNNYKVIHQWNTEREIQTTLPAIDKTELFNAITNNEDYQGYWWVEVRRKKQP